jgi:hypothetical protein
LSEERASFFFFSPQNKIFVLLSPASPPFRREMGKYCKKKTFFKKFFYFIYQTSLVNRLGSGAGKSKGR